MQPVMHQHIQPPPPPQPASAGPMAAQQYIVTINGDVGALPPTFNLKAIGITAFMQLMCTVMAVVLGVLAILVGCSDSFDGLPIWNGLCFFMVAGILGRVALWKRTRCIIIAYMVMSILSAIGAGVTVMSTVPAMLYEAYGGYYPFHIVIKVSVEVRLALQASLILLALFEMIVAIVASAFCCRGTCCTPANPLQVQYTPAVPAGSAFVAQGQPVMISQGQSITVNPTLPSYQAGPLPEKSATTMPPQAAPVGLVISAGPPSNPPAGQAASQQLSEQSTPAVDPDTIGHEISLDDDGTDQQPLVM